MKKPLLLIFALVAVASCAFAQSPTPPPGATGFSGTTFFFSTPQQTSSNTFNVTLSLSGSTPPADITSYDLYLVTDSTTASYFTLTAATPSAPFNAFSNSIVNGTSASFNTATGISGFSETDHDLNNFSSNGDETPTGGIYSFTFDTLTINTDSAPAGTYAFYTSSILNTSNGTYGSVGDMNGDVWVVGQGSFQIVIPQAVPEPSTWLAGFGATSVIGYSLLRRRVTG